MMKGSNSIFNGWRAVILALAVVLCGLPGPAYCQTHDPVLLLQQTPLQGGTITPDAGVHHFEPSAVVTLTAVPKPGYQFVYWLGDVSEPTANSTIVYLDAPKIVIAVFEQVEYEFLVMQEMSQGAPGGGSFPSVTEAGQQGFGGGGAKRPSKFRPPRPPEEEPGDFPVSEEGEENFPVPIPEPATLSLLALGGLALLRNRRAYVCKTVR